MLVLRVKSSDKYVDRYANWGISAKCAETSIAGGGRTHMFKRAFASVVFILSLQSANALELAQPGERINMLGDHKCFSFTLDAITYINRLGWTNATSLGDVAGCSMGATNLKNGQSFWIDDAGILNVSPMRGGPMLCHDMDLKTNWRSRLVGYCTRD